MNYAPRLTTIWVYYNNYCYQWNLKRMAPVQYRNHLLVA
ncbi:IS3 family transposase [Lysinibacillus sp. S2017]